MQRESVDINEAIETFLAGERRAGKSQASLRNYRADLASLQRMLGDSIPAARLSNAVQRHLRSLGLAERSWNRHLSTLRRFCDHLVRTRALAANPLTLTAHVRVEWQAPQAAHGDAVRGMFERIERPRDRALVALLWECGIRIGEALRLRRSDVDLKSGAIVVRGLRGQRCVQLPPLAKRLVSEYLAGQQSTPVSPIFLANGGRPLSYAAAHRSFRLYAGSSGVTMRQLRASAAACAFVSGARLQDVQNMLGHLHAENTARYHYDGVRRLNAKQIVPAGLAPAAKESSRKGARRA